MQFFYQFKHCFIHGDTKDTDGLAQGFGLGWCEVVFEDGTKTDVRSHLTDNYRDHARRAGYGTGDTAIADFVCEHEVAHHFLAEALGLPYSNVQWKEAHGVDWRTYEEELRDEERYVRWFQRMCNTGEWRPEKIKPLLEAGLDFEVLAARWRSLIVSMFGAWQWWRLDMDADTVAKAVWLQGVYCD